MQTQYVIILLAFTTVVVIGDNQFRSDYEYHASAAGWFKFHRAPARWQAADLRCFYEGAVLASPLNVDISDVMNTILNKNNKAASLGVHTGIHNLISETEYTSVEGVPLDAMPVQNDQMFSDEYSVAQSCMRLFPGSGLIAGNCSDALPYMCYKKRTEELENTICGTVDKGYQLNNRTGHCYKFHKSGGKWSHAFMVCAAEGGHLAIINSAEEADVLKELFSRHPADTLTGVVYRDGAHIGFLDWNESGVWRTIHGQSLEEAGYAKWGKNEPNNQFYRGYHQYCGSMFRSGLLDDTYCDLPLSFICEKDPQSLSKRSINFQTW